jgi:hypothetical protein
MTERKARAFQEKQRPSASSSRVTDERLKEKRERRDCVVSIGSESAVNADHALP